METQMTQNNNKNNENKNKGSGGGWALLVLAMLVISNQFIMNNITKQAHTDTVNEEEQEETVDATDSESEEVSIRVEPFEVVYSYGSEFRIVRFLPTDVLYVSHNRGDLTMMEDADGKPVTYATYAEFIEKEEYTITVESGGKENVE